ncbi:MAG TPA: hypothetical protein VEG39_19740 [Clostridia bacterium]|nr:hypothetical protein [Clostridia bacterium]
MLVLDEPHDDDVITQVGDRTFLVEDEIAETVKFFEIDFYKGWFRKAFVVLPNGSR